MRDGAPGAVVRRRWPVIVATALVVGIGAALWAAVQTDLYRAEAQLILSRTFIDASLTGTPDATAQTDPSAMAAVESTLSELPVVVTRTLRAVGLATGRTATNRFLERAGTELSPSAPVISFFVANADAGRAMQLANTWARTTDAYRVELDTRAVRAAAADIERRLARLERAGDTTSEVYRSLIDKQQQLRTVLTLQRASATIVSPATRAVQVTRSPVSAGVLGTIAGAILGLALVLLWELVRPKEPPRASSPRVPQRERAEELVR